LWAGLKAAGAAPNVVPAPFLQGHTMSEAQPRNITQRLLAVMSEVDYIRKDQKKIDGKYTAVLHDDVTDKLHPFFVKHGIVVFVRCHADARTVLTGTSTKGGTPYTRFEGLFDVEFCNADDPADFKVSTVPAFGLDEGDKGPGKASSYAVKYALLKTLMLVTGDQEESRPEEVVKVPRLTAEALKTYKTELLAAKTKAAINTIAKAARKQVVEVAGQHEGHPDWVDIFDFAGKCAGTLGDTK
jgi:hypothetical protein